jgi:membrane protein implicated in regulation of membrane protease activity
MSSGGEFVFGVALIVLGVSALAVSGELVLDSFPVIATGVVLAILGAILVYRGSRIRKQ